jgi:hypothetical protein
MKRPKNNLDLFTVVEIEEDKEKGSESCSHRHEDKTDTFWKDIREWRMTYTCRACGNIRGRAQ